MVSKGISIRISPVEEALLTKIFEVFGEKEVISRTEAFKRGFRVYWNSRLKLFGEEARKTVIPVKKAEQDFMFRGY